MKIESLKISDLKLITLKSFPDERGFFGERFKASQFQAEGLPTNFVQDNFSRSLPKILRGLHFQWERPQGKLVTCLRGRIFDVAVDLRSNSASFGQHVSLELSGDQHQWFWIPAGFAHGFCVLGTHEADVFYKCDNEYNAKGESGIVWNDSDLQIAWPMQNPIVSGRDRQMTSFKAYRAESKFTGSIG